MQPIIAVDVDGVLADLHVEWLKRYNAEFNDTLTFENISRWEMQMLVKPECGKKIFNYLRDSDLYDNVPPVQDSQVGVKALRDMGYRVVYVTSCVRGMADQKWDWLEKHGFLEAAFSQRDLIIAHDKSLIRADILVDDYHENFKGWEGIGYLFDAPYNRDAKLPVMVDRRIGWAEVVKTAANDTYLYHGGKRP